MARKNLSLTCLLKMAIAGDITAVDGVSNYTDLEMDVAALVVSKAAVAAQEAGAKGFALGNAVRKVVRHVTILA